MPKNKKTSTLTTTIAVVVDETGSMDVRRQETITAFNAYFEDIKKSDPDALVTVAEFSDMGTHEEKVRFLEESVPASDVEYLSYDTYRPRGNTPLYDAIGRVLKTVETDGSDRYLFVILTDGYENSSREFKREDIVKLISEKELLGNWTFVYLAADQNAWAAAQAVGISTPGTTQSYSGQSGGTVAATRSLSHSTADYLASAQAAAPDFFSRTKKKKKKVSSS